MRWVGLFLVLCLVLGGFVGVLVVWSVPVARAASDWPQTLSGVSWYGQVGTAGVIEVYTGEGTPTHDLGSQALSISGGVVTTPDASGYLKIDGAYAPDGVGLAFDPTLSYTTHYTYAGLCWYGLPSGVHTYEWSVTCHRAWFGSDYVTFTWSGSITSDVCTAYVPPLAVEISCGANFGELGETMTFYADVTGGWTPYAVQFLTVFNGVTTYMDVQNGSGSEYTEDITFTKYGKWTVGVKVVDGNSVPASDYMYVTIGIMKPELNGVVRIDSNGKLEFGVSKSEIGTGWEWGFGLFVNTGSYVVLSPGSKGKFPDHYILNAVAPFDNPLVVQIEYTESASGESWVYQFSFDMTDIDTAGEWTDSSGNDNVATVPDWLRPFFDWLRKLLLDVFNWLFVPTASQIDDLLPSGSLGASLLDGVAWTGAEAGEYTLHGHWTVNGSEVEVPLVSFNVSSVAASPFVGVVRKIVQAGVCLALVYMVVVLV